MKLSRNARGSLALVFAASFVTIVSCEAIVSDQVPQYTCDGSTAGSCPSGMYCKGAGCVACENVDVCDHLDNDCNGIVDDGKLCDADGDGYTWCGSLDADGHPQGVDCDDNDPDVHPGAPEVCNGKDDDCNGKIDDGVSCGGSLVCFNGECINNPCNPNNPADCTQIAKQHCDPVSHQCIDDTTVGVGSPCNADAECTSPLFCAKTTVLGANVVPGGASGMCTKPCCSSEDCNESSFVCYQPGNGGRYCVDPAKLGRGAVGSEQPGSPETTANRCRSGVIAGGRCIDTCCTDNNCINGTACAFGTLDNHDGFYCQASGGSGGQWSSCTDSTKCHDQACVDYGWFWGGHCVSQCCGSSSCGVVYDVVPSRCYFEQTSNNDYVGLCSEQTQGSGGLGVACTTSSDCISGVCYKDTSGQYCSDPCCVDSDCGNGFACRPAPTFPRCVKSP